MGLGVSLAKKRPSWVCIYKNIKIFLPYENPLYIALTRKNTSDVQPIKGVCETLGTRESQNRFAHPSNLS